MKRLNTFFYLCSIALCSLTLTSCGDGDDTSGNEGHISNGIDNGHQYVDLGLSVKWATCNIGADKAWEYGVFYSWADIESKELYNLSNCKFKNESGWTKYCTDSNNGVFDGNNTLDLEDDAAYQNWKGKWRMPTKSEMDELYNNCVWRYTSNYNGKGVNGFIVFKAKVNKDKGIKQCEGDYISTSATYNIDNDAHIFLPLAGHCDPKVDYINPSTGELETTQGKHGTYWTSTLRSDGCSSSYDLDIKSDKIKIGTTGRGHGETIRAVHP